MKKKLTALALIIIVILVIMESFVPKYFEDQLEEGFLSQVEQLDHLTVKISTHPAILLFFGQVQKGSVFAKGLSVEGLRIEEIDARYKNLAIAQSAKGVRAVAGINTYFKAIFLEDDLNRYLQARYSEFDQLSLDLTPEGVILNLQVKLLNTDIQLQLRGNFTIPNSHTIRFVLEGLDVAKLSIPTSLISRLLQGIEFDLELEELPLPVDLKQIHLEKDRMSVLGGIQ